MANLRAAQKAMTRQRLLDTALEVFREKGYAATTIDDIASAAGTTRVTFYAHFPSRRDVMRALIDELNALLDRHESSHGSRAGTLVDAVRVGTTETIGSWLREQAARWPAIKPYILVATEAAAIDAEIRGLLEEWFDEVIADIQEGLDQTDRFPPGSRYFRGELAVAQLDHIARHWMRSDWALHTYPALDVLTESWVGLLGDPTARR